jgi:hypothetical protein
LVRALKEGGGLRKVIVFATVSNVFGPATPMSPVIKAAFAGLTDTDTESPTTAARTNPKRRLFISFLPPLKVADMLFIFFGNLILECAD